MSIPELNPPYTPAAAVQMTLRQQGFVALEPAVWTGLAGIDATDLQALEPFWDDLPVDAHLKDGGRYRRRRHASFVVRDGQLQIVAHRAHWQPLDYNALHGGMHRWFEPLDTAMAALPVWRDVLLFLAAIASQQQGDQAWFGEAHPFRIDTTDGIGRPTPEGAHRDGVNWVAVFLLGRHGIKGGETRVFDMHSPHGQRFVLSQPWSLLLLNDQRVIHETTPIQPEGDFGWRDTLVITLRAGGFLSAELANPHTPAAPAAT